MDAVKYDPKINRFLNYSFRFSRLTLLPFSFTLSVPLFLTKAHYSQGLSNPLAVLHPKPICSSLTGSCRVHSILWSSTVFYERPLVRTCDCAVIFSVAFQLLPHEIIFLMVKSIFLLWTTNENFYFAKGHLLIFLNLFK